MSALEATIKDIRSHHRLRVYAQDQRKRADLSLGSYLRLALGWSKNLPEDERKAIAGRAADLMAMGEAIAKGKPVEADAQFEGFRRAILASILARGPFNEVEAETTKTLEALARTLPVWPWVESVRGFGAGSLATIIAETGDLSLYANPGKVWKRLGLAVIDGVRQGGLRGSASKEQWIAHGYSPSRRSRMWNVGQSIMKSNDGRYARILRERKIYEHAKAVAEGLTPASTTNETVERWKANGLPPLTKITSSELKKNPGKYRVAGHITRRAERYMEKRLIRDLWNVWHGRAVDPEIASESIVAAE